METYTHNPTEVQAIQVARPFVKVSNAVPFAHMVKASGRNQFSRFKVSAPNQDMFSAYEFDWIVKYPTGCWAVLTDEQFQRYYVPPADEGCAIEPPF